jgi:hypothetical protein
MNKPPRMIFRPTAVQRYRERQNEVILPHLISPRIIVYLWILLGLLGIAGCLAWSVKVPIYINGSATVVRRSNLDVSLPIQDDMVLLAFLPAGQQVHVGQELLVQWGGANEYLASEIIFVEPEMISPGDARRRFGLDGGAALAVTQPSTVAVARFVPADSGIQASSYEGCIFSILVNVGSRSVISLIPLIGSLLE